MKMISRYVREQKRYTKNDLRSIFKFDEIEVERFIKNLKSFGVLKSVKNNDAQKEMSDLVDEDIEITDGSEDSGTCLYVFTYVGVITCGSRIIKVYPKYLLSKYPDEKLLEKMRQIVRVLERYSRSEEQIINIYNGDGENKSFNLLAVILFLLKDYFENGVYTNSEDIIEINGEGDILWEKTIDESFALISDNRPYYMELYTRKTVDDDMDYFKRLHEYVITECSKQLRQAELSDLFGLETAEISDASIEDFGDREYILDRIFKELNIQYNTRKQILLKTIYAYIAQNRKLVDDNQGFSMYGTTAYHAVWEKMCADIFDNKLHKTLRQLNLIKKPDVDQNIRVDYVADGVLIECIKKPIWENKEKEISYEAKETLIPDLISFYESGVDKQFIIFDAKYYNIQLEKGNVLKGNPGVGDVTKQYLYQLAYKDFINVFGFTTVKNCFLMPTEKNEIISYGVARMPILENLGLENIQIRLLPGDKVAELYLANQKMDIGQLRL